MPLHLSTIIYALVAFAASAFLTKLVMKKLLDHAVLDTPNDRSMHKTPVPRGGGIAGMLVIIVGMAISLFITTPITKQTWILVAALLLCLISWLDDKKGAGVAIRLGTHLLAAFLGTLAFSQEQTIFGGLLPLWADRGITILGWAWFMNLYNFMDGIDGITCSETISIALGCLIILSLIQATNPFTYAIIALLTGACGGFLIFNWHPAKIFLGDVGSVPLGFLTGYILLYLATQHQLAAAIIIPLYYIADSGITITKRLTRGEKIWQAHRQHFYQRAAQATGRHDLVVLWISVSNFALVGSALVSVAYPVLGVVLSSIVVLLLLHKMNCSA